MYNAVNVVEVMRLVHHVMLEVHPREVHGQGKDGHPVYDYANLPFAPGQQRPWEPRGDPTVLLHFLGGGSQSTGEEGEDVNRIDETAQGLLNCIAQLKESASLQAVSKVVGNASEGRDQSRGTGAKKRQLYLAPRVSQLIMSAPTIGRMMLTAPEQLVTHVRPPRVDEALPALHVQLTDGRSIASGVSVLLINFHTAGDSAHWGILCSLSADRWACLRLR